MTPENLADLRVGYFLTCLSASLLGLKSLIVIWFFFAIAATDFLKS